MKDIVLKTTLCCLVSMIPLTVQSHGDAPDKAAQESEHSGHGDHETPAATNAGSAHQHHHHGQGWPVPDEVKQRPNPVAATPDSVERGQVLFAKNCASCHGVGGMGDGPAGAGLTPPPPNLVMSASHHPDGELAYKIAEGRGMMPSWKPMLQSDQIWDLVNYLKILPR